MPSQFQAVSSTFCKLQALFQRFPVPVGTMRSSSHDPISHDSSMTSNQHSLISFCYLCLSLSQPLPWWPQQVHKLISYLPLQLFFLSLTHSLALHVIHSFFGSETSSASTPLITQLPALHFKCNLSNVLARLLPASNDFPIILVRVFPGWGYIMDEIDLLSN